MKQLNQAGVPVVFVINQIDKHNEDEISFDTFKSRVEKSIAEWEIDLDKTFMYLNLVIHIMKLKHFQNIS